MSRPDSSIKDVVAAIRRHRSFFICAHVNPEGDALGSAIALALLVRRLGKKVILGNEGGLPTSLDFFPKGLPVLSRPSPRIKAEAAMIVDVPTLSRVGSMEPVVRSASRVINIDHHVSNQRFGDINWIDPKAAAVGEMIYRLYRAFHLSPRRPEALCMYTSIVTDTGSFRYMNTTPEVHKIAADLIGKGVSPLFVAQQLYEAHSLTDIQFLGDILKGVRHSPDRRIVWLEATRPLLLKYKASDEVLDELVNFPRSVKSAEVAFVLRETEKPGVIRVNLRSKGRINVNEIAKHFGGGGHMAASGCTIYGTMGQARKRLLAVAQRALRGRTASR